MIFHEVYGCYYNAVARIITECINGKLTESRLYEIVNELSYEESVLNIIPAIKEERWQLVTKNLETPILYPPQMPLTILEKRWLKTILSDKRVRLFVDADLEAVGKALADVEPLFCPADVDYFDRYQDGDPHESPKYIANFKILLQAIREHKKVAISYENRHHVVCEATYCPLKLEYSDKEDKFRVLCVSDDFGYTLNLGRIHSCRRLEETFLADTVFPSRKRGKVVLRLVDQRNALERVMMKFAHLKKQVIRLEDDLYEVELEYDKEDETDMLIQILSFGKYVDIIEGEKLKEEMRKRIAKQFATFFP